MEKTTMTMREFFEQVIKAEISPELTEKAQSEIEKLDARNSAKANRVTEKDLENEKIRNQIVEILGKETLPITSRDLADRLRISIQRTTSLCTILEKNEVITSSEVKIPKVGKRKAYSIA